MPCYLIIFLNQKGARFRAPFYMVASVGALSKVPSKPDRNDIFSSISLCEGL